MTTTLPIYQLDAFTSQVFGGNPAAVVPLQTWLDDPILQSIANENNLSETAFVLKLAEDRYALRWFTPSVEVDLCGHATLATARVLFDQGPPSLQRLYFETRSGELRVEREQQRLTMDFPITLVSPLDSAEELQQLTQALNASASEVYADTDYLVVLKSATEVKQLAPDMNALAQLGRRGVCVTAVGSSEDNCDFVARFFAPAVGINEDPVTGSAYCMLTPYWSQRLDKTTLLARQLSSRGGEIHCRLDGERVRIGGNTAYFLQGTFSF